MSGYVLVYGPDSAASTAESVRLSAIAASGTGTTLPFPFEDLWMLEFWLKGYHGVIA
jgi:hypothetical protein